MLGDEVAAFGRKRLWVLVSAGSRVVILGLDGHLLVDYFQLLTHAVSGTHGKHLIFESLRGLIITSPLKEPRWVDASLLLLLLAEQCVLWK
jgi:hypothetical protein